MEVWRRVSLNSVLVEFQPHHYKDDDLGNNRVGSADLPLAPLLSTRKLTKWIIQHRKNAY